MRLTATRIRTLSLPTGKDHKVFFDSDLPGFGLRHFSRAVETAARSTDTRRTRCRGDPGFSGAVSAIRRRRPYSDVAIRHQVPAGFCLLLRGSATLDRDG